MKILLPQELQFFTLPAYNAMVSVEEADVSLYDSKILIVGVLWLQSAEEWLVRRLMPIPWLKCWPGRRISDCYQCWVWPLTSDRAPHTTTPSTTSSTKKHAESLQSTHGDLTESNIYNEWNVITRTLSGRFSEADSSVDYRNVHLVNNLIWPASLPAGILRKFKSSLCNSNWI